VEKGKALETLERAVSHRATWGTLSRLGAAQYSVGAYEDALATLTRAQKIRHDIGLESGPGIQGLRAMALHQLGRDKEANAVMQQLRSVFERWFSIQHRLFRPRLRTVIKAEKLFAGQDSTLLSIWELIEEDRLDEASELIEKARQSEDADYVNRMEGAIKLLEVLRKRQ